MAALPEAQHSVFVGRLHELSVLEAALARATAGTGTIVLVVGAPGIGKSRLVEEFTSRAAAADAEILTGRCFEGPGAPAFWPWTQIVRGYVDTRDRAMLADELRAGAETIAAIVPELYDIVPRAFATREAIADDQARFRLFDTLTLTLRRAATRRPLVLVLEDFHGADRDSLLLLQFLARELRSSGMLVVVTLRDVASTSQHPMFATLGELVRERVAQELPLDGLSVADVAEMMERLGGTPVPPTLAGTVHSKTEGNPLYVAEIVRELAAAPAGFGVDPGALAIPVSVRSTIARNLEALSPPTREVLTVAALFGREFRLDVVMRAAGKSGEEVLHAIDEATAARLVTGRLPGVIRFTHALFAETLIESLSERRVHELHRHAASALAASPDSAGVVPEIAHHWWAAGLAGDPNAAVEWTKRAGDRAAVMLAHEEAMLWYRRALETLGWRRHDDPSLRAELLLAFGEAAKRASAVEEAKAAFAEAMAIGTAVGSPEIQTRAALGYAPAVTWAEQPAPDPVVIGHLETAIAAWEGRDSGWHARALARLALALMFGDLRRRSAAVSESMEMARRIGDAGALRQALSTALHLSGPDQDIVGRLAMATDLVRLGDQSRDLEALAVARRWRAVLSLQHGDLGGFEAERLALNRLVEQLRQPAWTWGARLLDVLRLTLAGRFDEAEQVLVDTCEGVRPTMPYAAYAFVIASRLYLWLLRGGGDTCIDEYRAAFGVHPDPTALSPLAWAEAVRGRHDEAASIVARIAGAPEPFRSSDLVVVSIVMLGEACALSEDRQHAAWLFELAQPLEPYWGQWAETLPLGPVTHVLGLLARALGRADDAARYLDRAITESRRLGARPYLARALVEQAITLRERDLAADRERARAMLAEGRAIAVELGMTPLAARIADVFGDDVDAEQAPVRGYDAPPQASPSASATSAVCRREGDYWTLTYDGSTVRLRDTRGIAYLAQLLWHAGRDFHATELVNLVAGRADERTTTDPDARVAASLGDAGTALDARASLAYRRRITELRDELAEAGRHDDRERATRVHTELDALTHELRTADRGKRAAAHAERARVAVTKGIGSVLARLRIAHPGLARHFEATVRRGYNCSYVPDPRHPIAWER